MDKGNEKMMENWCLVLFPNIVLIDLLSLEKSELRVDKRESMGAYE